MWIGECSYVYLFSKLDIVSIEKYPYPSKGRLFFASITWQFSQMLPSECLSWSVDDNSVVGWNGLFVVHEVTGSECSSTDVDSPWNRVWHLQEKLPPVVHSWMNWLIYLAEEDFTQHYILEKIISAIMWVQMSCLYPAMTSLTIFRRSLAGFTTVVNSCMLDNRQDNTRYLYCKENKNLLWMCFCMHLVMLLGVNFSRLFIYWSLVFSP